MRSVVDRNVIMRRMTVKRSFLSGNGQYWSDLRGLQNASLFSFSQVRVHQDMKKNILGAPPWK